MIVYVYITIDTEMSPGLYRKLGGNRVREIFDKSITGKTVEGSVGIHYQMDVLERNGLKGVFFVDPLSELVFGISVIQDIVQPIIARGHDVQLHLHSEWLNFCKKSPLGDRFGNNIKNFTLDDQVVLIQYACDILMKAGAPNPMAFRAGNYGANDDTLRALSICNIEYDTSLCPGFKYSNCEISLSKFTNSPVEHCGIVEVPVSAISDWKDRRRHSQVTAMSAWEFKAAIYCAQARGYDVFTIVSHSFELMSRDRCRINHIVQKRFEKICSDLSLANGITSGTYRENSPAVSCVHLPPLLLHDPIRTGARVCEQLASNWLYGYR